MRFLAAVFTALVLSSSAGYSASTAHKHTKAQPKTRALHVVHAVKLHLVASPDGAFSAAVPDETWQIRQIQAGPIATQIIISPGGQQAPAAYIWELLPIVDLATNFSNRLMGCARGGGLFYDPAPCVMQTMDLQARAAARQWSAAQPMAVIAAFSPQVGIALSDISLRPRSRAEAATTFVERQAGGTFDHKAIIRTAYAFNPYLSGYEGGRLEWATFAFMSGCKAPVGELAHDLAVCANILGSFHASPAWFNYAVGRAMAEYESQVRTSVNIVLQAVQYNQERWNMVSSTMSRIGQMQEQMRADIAASNAQINEGWFNSLGGQVDVKNPATGEV